MNIKAAVVYAVALVVGSLAARGQSDMIIKQRAKDLRDANNQQQGASPPTAAAPASPPPAAAPTTPPPAASPADLEAKQNLEKLEGHLAAINPGATDLAELKPTLETDLAALARGSVRPSQVALGKLADDLAAAFSEMKTPPRQSTELAQAVSLVVNSSMVSPAQAQGAIATAQYYLKSNGLPDAAIQTITADLKGIFDEVQQKKPKLYQ